MTTSSSDKRLPSAFIWRRLHSLSGIWLTVYLMIHLFTNSRAALWIGDDGNGFIRAVNGIHELPFLFMIELSILGIPIFIHLLWGIQYLRTANYNSFGSDGKSPYLPEYPRNRAYTWQRITSYLLMIGVVAHVVHMRVIEYPLIAQVGTEHFYSVRISSDEGLYTLAPRIGVTIYNQEKLKSLQNEVSNSVLKEQRNNWFQALEKRPLQPGEVIAEANNFGAVELLMVRDTFKMPMMLVLYTLFVLSACFHAFNGLWTAMITWGISLSPRSQRFIRKITTGLMIVVSALGLAAIWLTYWINLKH